MSLPAKSSENLQLVQHSLINGEHLTAVAGRLYYCVFQLAKSKLTEQGFDYHAFLQGINKPNERQFSHGTIVRAVAQQAKQRGISRQEIHRLYDTQDLYYLRIEADYRSKMIDAARLRRLLRTTNQILKVLTKL